MRLSQLRFHTAKGSFTQTARNRKFSCPRHDLFYSYSGKYKRGSQHLQQLRTGIIRSARPPGPVHCSPAPQAAAKGNAGSARVRLSFCRRDCRQEPCCHPSSPALRQPPCPCPACSTSPEPASQREAPRGWLEWLSPFVEEKESCWSVPLMKAQMPRHLWWLLWLRHGWSHKLKTFLELLGLHQNSQTSHLLPQV